MSKLKNIILYVLLFYSQACFLMTAGDILLVKKEKLYSTKNGRQIGDLSLSVEVKSVESNKKEFYLIIGERNSDNIVEGGKAGRSLWIFNKKISFNNVKKDAKNQDINLDSKGYQDLEPFTDTGAQFDIKSWNEMKRQTKYQFSVDAPAGRKVVLKLHFFLATVDKKVTTIDDDARVTIEFTIPQPESNTAAQPPTQTQQQSQPTSAATAVSSSQLQSQPQQQQQQQTQNRPQSPSPYAQSPNDQREVVLSERLNPIPPGGRTTEMPDLERQREMKAQAEELQKRTEDLNLFITVKNKEMASILLDIEELSTTKRKIPAKELDSIELVLSEMRKKVEYWDKGYTDILLKEEAIQDKFTKFSSDQTIAMKQLSEIRGKTSSPKDMLMKLGIFAAVFMMLVMLLMQILKPFLSKKKMAKLQAAQMKMMQGQSQVKGVGSGVTNIQGTISKI